MVFFIPYLDCQSWRHSSSVGVFGQRTKPKLFFFFLSRWGGVPHYDNRLELTKKESLNHIQTVASLDDPRTLGSSCICKIRKKQWIINGRITSTNICFLFVLFKSHIEWSLCLTRYNRFSVCSNRSSLI